MSAWRKGYEDFERPSSWNPPQTDPEYGEYGKGWAAARAMKSARRAKKAAKK